MALLDFIRTRNQPSAEQTEQPRQESAKQMYTRQAAEEQAAPRPSEMVRPGQQAKAAEAKALFDKAAQQPQSATPPPTPAPEGASNPQPMQQQGIGQERAAPEMSPTSSLASARAQEVDGPSAPSPTPAKSQQQTVARPAHSLER
jgi:hypothetical protein